MSAEEKARVNTLISQSYLGITLPLCDLMWAPARYPGVDVDAAARMLLSRWKRVAAQFEEYLSACGTIFFHGNKPHAGDFFVFEGVRAMMHAFGDWVVETLPNVMEFLSAIRKRPNVASHLSSCDHSTPLTDSPAETFVSEICAAIPPF